MIHVGSIASILSRLGERDIVVQPDSCVRLRSPRSKCNKCETACPHDVISWEGGLSIDPLLCDDCGLCAAACMNDVFILDKNDPTKSLEQACSWVDQNKERSYAAVRIWCDRAVEGPHLEKDSSKLDLRVPCYGALDGSFFANAFFQYTDAIEMGRSDCLNCSRSKGFDFLSHWIKKDSRIKLAAPNLISVKPLIRATTKKDNSAVISRRGFFSRIGSTIVGKESPTPVSLEKASILSRSLPDKQRRLIHSKGLEHWSSIRCAKILEDDCDLCGQCWMLCPTGALKNSTEPASDRLSRSSILFDPERCTGCMLCEDVCAKNAFIIDQSPELSDGNLDPVIIASFDADVCSNCSELTSMTRAKPSDLSYSSDDPFLCVSCRNQADIDKTLSELIEL